MKQLTLACLCFVSFATAVAQPVVLVDTPSPPPDWALLQREVLDSNADACEEFYDRYFDDRGFLECVERWGGDDGPDDAIECVSDWTLLYSLGGDARLLQLYKRAWEGHIRQYTRARTVDVPLARDGMYYREFPTMFDWVHLGEGSVPFSMQGLCTPNDLRYRNRAIRFAGFYLPGGTPEPNYDPEHRIIRSMFNGSRGPLLRKATALDWAGDPIEVEGRFDLRHGEKNYEQMLEHFVEYNDIVGDHPQNMCATSLAVNAYGLTQDTKYRDWIIEYVDAWAERMRDNGGIIPTNIGLNGEPGGSADGKWYGGVYGWGFSVVVPQSGHVENRNTHHLGIAGFGNALLMTGDQKYVDSWRTMIDSVNRHGKVIDGKMMYPHMHGDQGWYAFTPNPYLNGAMEVYYWSMKQGDRERVRGNGWLNFLAGNDADYPARALRGDLRSIRTRVQSMRNDTTTADTRLSDDPLPYNPATAGNLVQLMNGGLYPGRFGGPFHARLRYFDPVARRAGIAPNVASLVTRLTDDETHFKLINTSQLTEREVVVQLGTYGEHHCNSIEVDGRVQTIDGSTFRVRLNPGCGTTLKLNHKRYVNQPTLTFPWDRESS